VATPAALIHPNRVKLAAEQGVMVKGRGARISAAGRARRSA
jgi:hypothetical protein